MSNLPGGPQGQGYGNELHHYHHIAYRPTKSWMNIVGFVLALIGLGLGAVIFGHLGVAAANRGDAEYKGLGIAALIIGYINLALVAALLLMYFGFLALLFGAAGATATA